MICGLFLDDVSSSLLGARLRGVATRLWIWTLLSAGGKSEEDTITGTQKETPSKLHNEKKHRHMQTGTQRYRDSDRQRHRQTERERERERHGGMSLSFCRHDTTARRTQKCAF